MYKTRGAEEKQGEILARMADLEPGAIQAVLLERAKQAALAMAVALWEQDAEALCGERYGRKREGQGYRGGHEQTRWSLKARGMGFGGPGCARATAKWNYV